MHDREREDGEDDGPTLIDGRDWPQRQLARGVDVAALLARNRELPDLWVAVARVRWQLLEALRTSREIRVQKGRGQWFEFQSVESGPQVVRRGEAPGLPSVVDALTERGLRERLLRCFWPAWRLPPPPEPPRKKQKTAGERGAMA